MTPEQMQNIAANASPEMIQQAQNMMKNMSPEQMEQMQRMAAGMGMAPPGGGMPNFSAREKYEYDAALQLKTEGNACHSRGDHKGAVEKYERARTNIASQASKQAADLRKACTLNIAMCQLKLEQFQACADECTSVIRTDAADLKALYRRGQAYMGLESWQAAARDLVQAEKLAANDAVQLPLIRAKLAEAAAHCSELPAATADPSVYRDGDVVIEDVTDEQPTPSPAPTRQVPPLPAGMPAVSQAQRDAALRAVRENPEQMHGMAAMMENMSDADFERMQAASGMGKLDRNMAKQAASMMKGMSPEDLKNMAELAARMDMGASGAQPGGAAAGSPAAASPGMNLSPDMMTPEMMKMATDMMSTMKPEDMANMQRMASQMGTGSASAGGAGGMKPSPEMMTPEMMKMATNMMSTMKPEDMANMQRMASQMGTGSAGAGGVGGMPDMSAMMKDPKAMESMMKMMNNMDEDSLVNMLKMSQPNMDEAAARKAAQSMKGLDERSMKMLLTVASSISAVGQRAQQAKAWLLARPGVMLAIVMLLLGLLLRYFGLM